MVWNGKNYNNKRIVVTSSNSKKVCRSKGACTAWQVLLLFKQDQMIIKKDGFQAEIRLFVFYIILYKLLDIHIVV